jgi:hypothetical protein
VTDGVGDQFGDGQDHVINMVAIDLGWTCGAEMPEIEPAGRGRA